MILIRKSEERGAMDYGWLQAKYSFSFAGYFDPRHTGFRDLKVINQDIIAPGMGFGTHPHRDMEIVTYIIEGAIEHKDSEGNSEVIREGEIQRMTAGKGIRHSEYNACLDRPTQVMQIWIDTDRLGHTPGYRTVSIREKQKEEILPLIVSPDGRDGSVDINQDVFIYAGKFKMGDSYELSLSKGRHAWVQLVAGELKINGVQFSAGDGGAISGESELKIDGSEASEFLLFDLR